MERIEAVVESFTFRLLSRPREHILSALHPVKKQKRLERPPFPIPEMDSDEPVYRIVVPKQNQVLRGVPKLSGVIPE